MAKLLCLTLGVAMLGLSLTSNASAASLAGSEWRTENSPEQFIQFSAESKVSGFAGCNRFFGSYSLRASSDEKSGTLQFKPLTSTKKGCAAAVMKAEFEFFQYLGKVRAYERSKMHLELFDEKVEVDHALALARL